MLSQKETDRLLRLQAQKEVYDLAKRWEIEPLSEVDLQEIWAEWVGCFRRVTKRTQKEREGEVVPEETSLQERIAAARKLVPVGEC